MNITLGIQEVLAESDRIRGRLEKLQQVITAFREICPHHDAGFDRWEPAGSDSHHHYQKCPLCGKEEIVP
jgi:hypothetical protein